MLLLVGEVRDISRKDRESARGVPYVETTIVVLTDRAFIYARVAPGDHFRGNLPAIGSRVALEVSVETYVKKQPQADGRPATGHSYTAWAVSDLLTPAPETASV